MKKSAGCIGILMLACIGASAEDLSDITNFRNYSPTLASAGQPNKKQLKMLQKAGFERVVYIAYDDHDHALPDEDRLVKELGMDYLQVPVEWTKPTKSDFYLVAGALQREPGKKTLLHCQANYRASAFGLLYRVLYENVPLAVAKQDMDAVWQPNETWRRFIFEILEENGISPHCADCNWGGDTS